MASHGTSKLQGYFLNNAPKLWNNRLELSFQDMIQTKYKDTHLKKPNLHSTSPVQFMKNFVGK